MSNLRVFSAVLGGVLAACALSAQSSQPVGTNDLVTIGGCQAHPTRVLVRYARTSEAANPSTLSTLSSLGLKVVKRYPQMPDAAVLDFKPSVTVQSATPLTPEEKSARLAVKMEVLKASGLFRTVEPDYVVYPTWVEPTDDAYQDGRLWGLHNIGQGGGVTGADVITNPDGGDTNAWDLTIGSTNVIVAVIDTGVRYTHRDLAAQMWVNPDEIPNNGVDDDGNGYVDDVHGINSLLGSGDPMDDHSHGSHCAGTIGAAANNGSPHVGVAWHVQIMACKLFDSSGRASFGFTSDVVECIGYAVSKKARILSNSWGGPGYSDLVLEAILSAHTNNVLFVAAAGNDALDNDQYPNYPSNYETPNMVAVAAIDRFDRLADFSNYGKTTVHLGAPGVDIFSCYADSDTAYGYMDGTSMACPHVSGVAALVLGKYPTADVTQLRQRLLMSAVPIAALAETTITGGRVNAYRALQGGDDGIFEVAVNPPNLSTLLTNIINQPVFVTVSDLFAVTNATVKATFVGSPLTVTFVNDGTRPDVRTNDNVYSAYFDLVQLAKTAVSNTVTFNLTVTAPGKQTFTNSYQYFLATHPLNDNFDGAFKIRPGGAFGDALTATIQPIIQATNTLALQSLEYGEPVHAKVTTARSSLWWTWSPGADGPVLLDTSGSSFDTVAAVYTGTALTNLVVVASGDNANGREQANFTFNVKRGVTYRIAVAGANTNDYGHIRLRIEPNGQLDTGLPELAIIAPLNGAVSRTNIYRAIFQAFDPQPNASGVKEVRYRFNGAVPQIAPPKTDTPNQWQTVVNLRKGANTIEAFALDYSDNVSGSIVATVYYQPIEAPNDVFASAAKYDSVYFLKDVNGTQLVNNLAASKEGGEPDHAGDHGGRSVWWSWQAPASGALTLAVWPEKPPYEDWFDSMIAVYTGDKVSALSPVASAVNFDWPLTNPTNKLTFLVTANTIYRIAIDGYGGAGGKSIMEYSFTPAPMARVEVVANPNASILLNDQVVSGWVDVEANSSLWFTMLPTTGNEFVRWEYSVAGATAVSAATNTIVLTPPGVLAFEDGKLGALRWETDGWTVTDSIVSVAQPGTPPETTGKYVVASGSPAAGGVRTLKLTAACFKGVGTFDYRTSSATNADFLEFVVDGTVQRKWSGGDPWASHRFNVAEGTHVFEWRYRRSASAPEGLNAAFLDNLALPLTLRVAAVTAPHTFADNFESGSTASALQWEVEGWTAVPASNSVASGTAPGYLGSYVLSSGQTPNSASHTLKLSANCYAGQAKFDRSVSSEEGWDVLEFRLDGLLLQTWSGDVSWSTYEFPVTTGAHTFEWTYTKDRQNAAGLDAAFVDNLDLPLVIAPNEFTRAKLVVVQTAPDYWELQVTGQAGQAYVIETTTSITAAPIAWQPITTNALTQGVIRLPIGSELKDGQRYYRAIVPKTEQ